MSLKNSSGDLESESEYEKWKMSLGKSEGEEGLPCDLEPDTKKLKTSLEEEELIDEKMSLDKSSGEEQSLPGDGDVELEDEKSSSDEGPWSSDEELKEEDMEAFLKYEDQVYKSGGFDIEYCPPFIQCILFPVEDLKEEDEEYKSLCTYSQLALQKFNQENNTRYKFVQYVKATAGICAGFKYYITFEAKEEASDDSDDSENSEEATTTFQALVYEGMRNGDGTFDPKVRLVRMKSSANLVDNKILLC